jgi:hypothetical protein
MRGDAKARGEFYKAMRDVGAFTPNMILQLEDFNPIGPEGDKHVMQSQYTTLARIGEDPPAADAPADTSDMADSDEVATPPADKKRRPNGAGLAH